MFLARVEGSVVSTKKDPTMDGRKLLLLRPQLVDDKDPTRFRAGTNTIVAVDGVGAGLGELVMFCQADRRRLRPNHTRLRRRRAVGLLDQPLDVVDVFGKEIYNARNGA